jgi:hypothetical protein
MSDENAPLPINDILAVLAELLNSPVKTNDGSGSTSKSYKQYSLQQVKGLAESAFQEAIGRAPSVEELGRFQASLNAAEKGNSATTSGSSASSVTYGGVDTTQFAKDTAELAPEYANYQKATTYFDTMINSLRGPVGGGM